MKITAKDLDGLAALVDVVGAYGRVTSVDDALAHITIELIGVAYRFAVRDGNVLGVDKPIVLLLSVAGTAPGLKSGPAALFVDETAGSFEVPPGIAEQIAARFDTYGLCEQCEQRSHVSCLRQHADASCRCQCSAEWAVGRVKAALEPLSQPRPVSRARGLASGELLPGPAARPSPCGCECQAGRWCGGCGHAGCANRR